MVAIQSNVVWFFIFIHVSNCQRRIQEGFEVKAEKPYVVYLVKAPISASGYDYWLCGGALVTSEFVVTSAACIKDVDFMYAIAGYKKYITDEQIDVDQCTREKKKKVIYTCYPDGYQFRYERLDKWSLIDIGVARVESPYDFGDESFKTLCDYVPSQIPINFESKYQDAGVDAIVLGWGHKYNWRQPEDLNNYNQPNLNYAPVKLIDKKECRGQYEEYGRMPDVIDRYMICTSNSEPGNIDDYGVQNDLVEPAPLLDGCDDKRKSLASNPGGAADECEYEDEDGTRRDIKKSSNDSMSKIGNKNTTNKTTAEGNRTTVSNKAYLANRTTWSNRNVSINRSALINRTVSSRNIFMNNKTHFLNTTVRNSRRYGICQNDHGGPLVAWIGGREVLIGVASVFKVSETSECYGPYLYTSTQCSGAFLDCILAQSNFDELSRSSRSNSDNSARRSFCRKSSDDERHPTTERHISWLYHPAGAADHERHLIKERNEPHEQAFERNEEDIYNSGMRTNPVNKMISSHERYPPIENNKKSSVNVNNTPNENDEIYENFDSYAYQRGAPENKYVDNYQYPPRDTRIITNDKYSPYNGPVQINGPKFYNGPVLNYRSERVNNTIQNNRPEIKFKSEQINNHALNNGPEKNFKSERVVDHTPSNGSVLNFESEGKYDLTPNSKPPVNFIYKRFIDQAPRHEPVHNNEFIQNNEPAQKNRSAIVSRPKPKDK